LGGSGFTVCGTRAAVGSGGAIGEGDGRIVSRALAWKHVTNIGRLQGVPGHYCAVEVALVVVAGDGEALGMFGEEVAVELGGVEGRARSWMMTVRVEVAVRQFWFLAT
jgi:hypothetical protein